MSTLDSFKESGWGLPFTGQFEERTIELENVYEALGTSIDFPDFLSLLGYTNDELEINQGFAQQGEGYEATRVRFFGDDA